MANTSQVKQAKNNKNMMLLVLLSACPFDQLGLVAGMLFSLVMVSNSRRTVCFEGSIVEPTVVVSRIIAGSQHQGKLP
jgi:hypothetical protein